RHHEEHGNQGDQTPHKKFCHLSQFVSISLGTCEKRAGRCAIECLSTPPSPLSGFYLTRTSSQRRAVGYPTVVSRFVTTSEFSATVWGTLKYPQSRASS